MKRLKANISHWLCVAAIVAFMATLTMGRAEAQGARVVQYILVNADTNKPIRTIEPGSVINLEELPTSRLNVQIVTSPQKVVRVISRFKKMGSTVVDTAYPYSLGDKKGKFAAYPFAPLTYSLSATPYQKKGTRTVKGETSMISFTFVKSAISFPTAFPTRTPTSPPAAPGATPTPEPTPTEIQSPTPTPTNTPEPVETHETSAALSVDLVGANEFGFNPLNVVLGFAANGGALSTDPRNTTVLLNGKPVSSTDLTFAPSAIAATLTLAEGRNSIELFTADASGLLVQRDWVLWAGSYNLTVKTQVSPTQSVSGASVKLRLGDDPQVLANGITVNGQVTFSNLPDRTVSAEATTGDNLHGIAATTGKSGSTTILLSPIDGDSQVDNNDFSHNWDGWNIGKAPTAITDHVESTVAVPGNKDGTVATDLIGSQSITRTFRTKPGTRRVTIRYRFQTDEFPTYFGTKYNDFYSITVRTLLGGKVMTEGRSMNALGKAAFNSNGATEWKEFSVPVSNDQDVVHIEFLVANVGDGLYDSKLIIDQISEGSFAIKDLVLRDLDTRPLTHLSVSPHNYLNKVFPVLGTLRFEGPVGESVRSIVLEVSNGGVVVATVPIVEGGKSKLLNIPFGDSQQLSITEPETLFYLTQSQLTPLNTAVDEVVTLKVIAQSNKNNSVSAVFGTVPKLIRYASSNRFGVRNNLIGGDDWALPSIKGYLEKFTSVQWNNISNMHGGRFLEDHPAHAKGTDADGTFPSYVAMDGTTAATLLAMAKDTALGPKIAVIFVTYDPVTNATFANTLKDVVLPDGRKATDVIRNWPGHEQYFHMRMRP